MDCKRKQGKDTNNVEDEKRDRLLRQGRVSDQSPEDNTQEDDSGLRTKVSAAPLVFFSPPSSKLREET